ncbi:hypothetical protein ACFTY8_26560 [Streptomyces mirabilis]|uniref:hypothetical protein n=1 Tax=Streptomyces mirabilis TaxID=68239 RepID=UPI0036276562
MPCASLPACGQPAPSRPPELRPLLELCATSPRRVTWKDDDELRRLARTLLDEPMPS